MKMICYMYRIFLHPFDSLARLKEKRDEGWLLPALLSALLLLLSNIVEYQYTDFTFNTNRVDQLNIWLMLFKTVGLLALWVLSNWSFCTLFDGEGTLKQIFVMSSLVLVPYSISLLLKTGLSLLLVAEEEIFLSWIVLLGQIYSGVLMLIGLYVIHGFTVKKTIFTVLFTVVGIVIILFIMALLFSLVQQFSAFIMTIFSEISLIIGG